jgi:hypothetical protein
MGCQSPSRDEGWDKFQNVIKMRQLARWILSRRASSASGRIQTIRRNLIVYHSLVLTKHRENIAILEWRIMLINNHIKI